MKKFLATALLLASVLPAAAQTTAPTMAPSDVGQPAQGQPGAAPMHHHEWSDACKAKMTQMCPDAKQGVKGAYRDCLKAQNTSFAQVCPEDAAALKARREAHQNGVSVTAAPARQSAPVTNGSATGPAPVTNGQ